jgi:hypothetical protein
LPFIVKAIGRAVLPDIVEPPRVLGEKWISGSPREGTETTIRAL